MASTHITRALLGALTIALVLSGSASAQAPSVFVDSFTTTVLNPCMALEPVVLTGSTTITMSDTLTPQGDRKISVSVVDKGTGVGQVSLVNYAFSDTDSFTVRAPLVGAAFDSTFSHKRMLKGAKSVDNWIVRAIFRLKIAEDGTILVTRESETTECKG